MRLSLHERPSELRCAIRHDALTAGVACPRCAVRFHQDCRRLVARCPSLGRDAIARLAAPVRVVLPANPLRLWSATANPALPPETGTRSFATDQDGVIFYTTEPGVPIDKVRAHLAPDLRPIGH